MILFKSAFEVLLYTHILAQVFLFVSLESDDLYIEKSGVWAGKFMLYLNAGQHQKDNSTNSDEKFPPTTAIYATPSSPEATVHKLENPVYGDISNNEDDMNVRDFQNPVYGDAEDDCVQQDELYTAPQAPQPVSLGMEGDGPEYDYATSPGAGVVTMNIKTNGSTPASHEYTVMDESNRKKAELDVMEPYERLHHGIEPPDFVRLAEVEGAEYGSLQWPSLVNVSNVYDVW